MQANIIQCESNHIKLPIINETFRYDENTVILADQIPYRPDPSHFPQYFTRSFITLDISNPLNVKIIGRHQLETAVRHDSAFISGKILSNKKIYCINDKDIVVFDAADPCNIRQTKIISTDVVALEAIAVSADEKIYAMAKLSDTFEKMRFQTIGVIEGDGKFRVIGPEIESNVVNLGFHKDMLLAAGWQHGLSFFDFTPDGTLKEIKTVAAGASTMPADMYIVDDHYYFGANFENLVVVDISEPKKAKRLKLTKNNRVNMFMNGLQRFDEDILVYGNGDKKCELLLVAPTPDGAVIKEVFKFKGAMGNVILKDHYVINLAGTDSKDPQERNHLEVVEIQ